MEKWSKWKDGVDNRPTICTKLQPQACCKTITRDLPTVSGPTSLAKDDYDTVDGSWILMVIDQALQEVNDCTNIKINKLRKLMATSLTENNKKTQCKLTSVAEIMKLFRVFYMRGALWKTMIDINTIFFHKNADPMFSSALESKRLLFLCTII